mgnify:CR=1 FL=1
MKSDEDCTVDLQDITSSGFTYARNLIWMALATLSGMASLFLFVTVIGAARYDRPFFTFWLFAFLMVTVLFSLLFVISKKTIYEVTFAGGTLSIKASSYGVQEVRAFDKALRREKDSLLKKMH